MARSIWASFGNENVDRLRRVRSYSIDRAATASATTFAQSQPHTSAITTGSQFSKRSDRACSSGQSSRRRFSFGAHDAHLAPPHVHMRRGR